MGRGPPIDNHCQVYLKKKKKISLPPGLRKQEIRSRVELRSRFSSTGQNQIGSGILNLHPGFPGHRSDQLVPAFPTGMSWFLNKLTNAGHTPNVFNDRRVKREFFRKSEEFSWSQRAPRHPGHLADSRPSFSSPGSATISNKSLRQKQEEES